MWVTRRRGQCLRWLVGVAKVSLIDGVFAIPMVSRFVRPFSFLFVFVSSPWYRVVRRPTGANTGSMSERQRLFPFTKFTDAGFSKWGGSLPVSRRGVVFQQHQPCRRTDIIICILVLAVVIGGILRLFSIVLLGIVITVIIRGIESSAFYFPLRKVSSLFVQNKTGIREQGKLQCECRR